ncbi:MAG: hypothetical protein JRI80_04935 [Deltaproteobacteria bacterium]|nr:hypothetical protein [Deltaproteobacteria bacterium]
MSKTINANAQPEPKGGEQQTGGTQGGQQGGETYLGDWKTKEEAEKGFASMKELLDRQGNELGLLRKQTDFFQQQLQTLTSQQQPAASGKRQESGKPQGPDYSKEIAKIQDEMAQLDPDEPDYGATFAKLHQKSLDLVAQQAKQEALTAAQAEFQKVLEERDIQKMQEEFYRENPDFNTPEMQQRIQEYMAKDPTGMSDPMVAYREIQRDDAMAEKARLQAELEEKERLLALKKGEDITETVVTKGQSPSGQQTKQTKVTGADLDKGMLEALRRAKGA